MRPNPLLKVVSILYIVFSSIAILLSIFAATFAGSLVSMLFDAAGVAGAGSAGLLTGSALLVVAVLGSLLSLAAGILGVKGKFTGCKVMGIILLVLAVINVVGSLTIFDSSASMIVTSIVRLILPVLYVWGAYKGPAEG